MQSTTKIEITVLVLGGGYAGLSAATRVARLPGAKVILIDARDAFFERIRLHEDLCRSGARRWPCRDLLSKHGIEFVQGTVVDLDPAQCSVTIEESMGLLTLNGDYVVYALGSYPIRNAIPGLESFGHTLTDLDQVQHLATAMARINAPRIVVGGGGLTALELASELSESYPGAQITLVSSVGLDPHDDPGGLSRRASAHVRRTLTSLGVAILESQRVTSLEPTMAHLSDGEAVQFDHYIHAAGFVVPDLARLSGLAVDNEGRILVDDTML
ncbi:MAG: NAD(P)/FAD-dependent oxidoreductase [Acidimicrobiales bacterium]